MLGIREDINRKKTFSFGHCPKHLAPPPPDPNSGNLVLFFYVKNDVLRVWPEKRFDADNEGCSDNYDDNYGNFDYNYDKTD